MNENLPAEVTIVTDMIQAEKKLTDGLMNMKDKIMMSACEEVLSWKPEKQDTFLQKTALAIARDENIKPCFESTEGKLSILNAVHRSVSTGLEIGGIHAYLVPQGRSVSRQTEKGLVSEKVIEARYSIRDRGYHALLCGGKKPIFSELRWGMVYEKDQCTVNGGTGEVNHEIGIEVNRGKFLGCWVQCEKISGQKEAQFFHKEKIAQWRAKAKTQNVWNAWPEEMALQASIRHFCDRYEQARELLSSAIYDDESGDMEGKPIEEKVNGLADSILENPEPEESEPIVVTEEEHDTTGLPETEDGELF